MPHETPLVDQAQAAELSIPDALAFGLGLQRAGRLDDAAVVYERVLEVAPEQPDALNFLAMIATQRSRVDDAIAFIRRAIAADPTQGERYNNLGNVLLTAERIDEAVSAYEQAIVLAPEHAAAYNNLGIIYRAQQRYDDAERVYKRALEIDPAQVEAYTNYGNLFAARGNIKEAIKLHAKALTLRPQDQSAKTYIAQAYASIGDIEGAAKIYRNWLESEPDHPGARHMLAACSGVDVPARAPDDYIVRTFDSFSTSFDAKLAKLNYRAPELVACAVEQAVGEPARRLHVLDAGCGTGLCGPLVAEHAATLEGVDLSGGMLEKARARGVYGELFKAELTQFLQSREAAYDLVISADTLVYFGDLADAMHAAARALRPGGVLVYTVEKAEDADAPAGFRINPHGRYSHTRDYVERVLADAGFAQAWTKDEVLRMEMAVPVQGLVVTARKDGAAFSESNDAR